MVTKKLVFKQYAFWIAAPSLTFGSQLRNDFDFSVILFVFLQ